MFKSYLLAHVGEAVTNIKLSHYTPIPSFDGTYIMTVCLGDSLINMAFDPKIQQAPWPFLKIDT